MTTEAEVVVNPRAAIPFGALLGGYLLCIVAAVLLREPLWSVGVWIVATGLIAGGSLLVPPTPILLPAANVASVIFLLLQVFGACSYHCSGSSAYSSLGGISTAWLGIVAHVVLASLGIARTRWSWLTGDLYRVLMGLVQGVSAFFAILMLAGMHWCPSCAAVHAAMLGQVILAMRLMPVHHGNLTRGVLLGSLAIGALLTNAMFHHGYQKPRMEPSDALIGYLERMREAGGRIATVEVSEGSREATPPEGAGPAPGETPLTQPEVQARATLSNVAGMRIEDFDLWGSPTAPITIRAHLSPTCPGCRQHWPQMFTLKGKEGKTLEDRVKAGEVQVRFLFTWPVTPRTHFGCSLAVSVLYACGMLGQEELILAGERMFSADGALLLDRIDSVIAEENNRGPISVETERQALAQLIHFLSGSIDTTRLTKAYVAYHGRSDDLVKKNVSWLFEHGSLDTPRFFYLRSDAVSGPSYLDTSNLDPEVVGAFVARGLQPNPLERRD